MEIRAQPRIFTAPRAEPFVNDLLEREESVEVLTRVVSSIIGPCVIAVDAPWGAGKTAFLTMWARHLRNQEFPVVEFNAWETDFSGDPFVALTSELTEGLKLYTPEQVVPLYQSVRQKGAELLSKVRNLAPLAVGIIAPAVASQVPELGAVTGPVAAIVGHSIPPGSSSTSDSGAVASFSEERLEEYEQSKALVKEFNELLGKLARALSKSNGNKPLVILIDELDRCRPSYAVELLESAKHLFSVDHIVFVLGVNRAQLAHSVRALYGHEFKAEEYLKRFVDLEYELPAADRTQFITEMLSSVGFDTFFERTADRYAQTDRRQISLLLLRFFRASDLDLRSTAQALHRFGLVLSSLSDDEYGFLRTLAVLFLIKSADATLYSRFLNDEVQIDEMINSIFQKPGFAALQQTDEANLVEAVIIAAKLRPDQAISPERTGCTSRSYIQHSQKANTDEPDNLDEQIEWSRSRDIYDLVLRFHHKRGGEDEDLGFDLSVRRLGLFSSDLMDTHEA